MPLIILVILIVLLLSQSSIARTDENGFSLELIHRDSIASPLYPGNLTEIERIQRMVRFSESYDNHLQYIRPHVVADKLMYLVKVSIGSNNPVALYLWVSLSHALTWTQCEPCSQCFPQQGPIYKPGASTTFKPISGNHDICKPPDYHPRGRERCDFILRNPDGSNAIRGTVAREKFTFASSIQGHATSLQDVIFGCAHESAFPPGHHNPKIGGVFGMSPSAESFPAQLAARTGQSFVFSYCLVHGLDSRITYLRFGSDQASDVRGEHKITRLILRPDLHRYYVHLLDISVGGRRLNLPPGTFGLRENGNGGCVLDVAHWATVLIRPAYDAVTNAMAAYFGRYPFLVRTDGRDMGGLDLCYLKRRGGTGFEFPSVEFHFPEATLRVVGKHSFVVHPPGATSTFKFCLLMQPNEAATMIGAAHQQNVRVTVNVPSRQVTFVEASRCLLA